MFNIKNVNKKQSKQKMPVQCAQVFTVLTETYKLFSQLYMTRLLLSK